MDKEKFDIVLGYFKDYRIELPTAVRNAIEDVFMENDSIDTVECYHKEDLESFQSDLVLENNVKLHMGGGHSGHKVNVWTYYGEMSYSLKESILLLDDDGSVMEEISEYESGESTSLVELPTDYVISLIETVDWDGSKKEFSRKTTLYIYCPVALDDGEEAK